MFCLIIHTIIQICSENIFLKFYEKKTHNEQIFEWTINKKDFKPHIFNFKF